MKTVLLAIDRLEPHRNALDYALTLCRRMSAGLEVLHIVHPPKSPGRPLKRRNGRLGKAGEAFERAMVTITFAEAGVPDPAEALKAAARDRFQRILPQSPQCRIAYRCVVSDEAADHLIERYVRNRRQIVLTIFDPRARRDSSGRRRTNQRSAGTGAMPQLSIPLVLVKDVH